MNNNKNIMDFVRRLQETNYEKCSSQKTNKEMLFLAKSLGIRVKSGQRSNAAICEAIKAKFPPITKRNLSTRQMMQQKILGDELYELCTSNQPVPAGFISERASELQIPSYKLLQVCDMQDVIVSPGNALYDMSIEPDKLPARSSYEKGKSKDTPYTITHLLNKGGFGKIHLATVNQDGKPTTETVAIKEFFQQLDFNEIDLLFRWNHPNVLHAKDLIWDHLNRLMVVMPLASSDVDDYCRDDTIPMSVRVRWVQELFNGMAFIQSQGYFHCDMKPENCLLIPIDSSKDSSDPENLRLVIADLGMTYPYEYQVLSSSKCGTPTYVPLEMQFEYNFWLSGYLFPKSTILTDAFREFAKILSGNTSFQPKISEVDMFLAGNTALFILTGQTIFGGDYRSFLKDNDKVHDRILQYIKNPNTPEIIWQLNPAIQNQVVQLQTQYPEVYQTVTQMLHAIPSARPRNFVQCLQSINTSIVLGHVLEVVSSRNLLSLSNTELELITKQAKAIIKFFVTSFKNSRATEMPYDMLLTALTLLYRSFPSHGNLCLIEEVSAACVFLASKLARTELWASRKDGILMTQCDPDLRRMMTLVLQITMYLKGSLRFPYLYQAATSEKQLQILVHLSVKEPSKFIELILSPWRLPIIIPSNENDVRHNLDDIQSKGPKFQFDDEQNKMEF